jgi:predicted nucleic acid-binding protein
MITLDSSGIVSLVNNRDPDHEVTSAALLDDHGPYIVPVAVLSEATFVIERRAGVTRLEVFLLDLINGAYLLDCGDADMERILALVRRYADLPLDFSDAAVIACAERNGGKVLTLDYRHFGVVAREGTITVVPELT